MQQVDNMKQVRDANDDDKEVVEVEEEVVVDKEETLMWNHLHRVCWSLFGAVAPSLTMLSVAALMMMLVSQARNSVHCQKETIPL